MEDYYRSVLRIAASRTASWLGIRQRHLNQFFSNVVALVLSAYDFTGPAMIFVLMFAIVGELVTFAVIIHVYGFTIALLIAPGGGVLMALLASVFLSKRYRTSSAQPLSGVRTETGEKGR